MIRLGQMAYALSATYLVKGVTSKHGSRTSAIHGGVDKLNTVIPMNNGIRYSRKFFEKSLCLGHGRLGSPFRHDKFGCTSNGGKEVEFAFFNPGFRDVGMEKAKG